MNVRLELREDPQIPYLFDAALRAQTGDDGSVTYSLTLKDKETAALGSIVQWAAGRMARDVESDGSEPDPWDEAPDGSRFAFHKPDDPSWTDDLDLPA